MQRTIQYIVNSGFNQLLSRSLKHELLIMLFKNRGITPRGLFIDAGDRAVMVGSPNALRVNQFAKLTGNKGSVLFVEPEPTNFDRLQSAASEYSHVKLDNRGAWSISGTQELLLGEETNPGDNKIEVSGVEHDNDYRTDNYQESIQIQVAKLDTILSDNDVNPDYIEIMVNGAELKVLKGLTETLANMGPRLLIKGHARDDDTGEPINEQIVDFLEEFGYGTAIGAGGDPTVGETEDWDRRKGDVYGWKRT